MGRGGGEGAGVEEEEQVVCPPNAHGAIAGKRQQGSWGRCDVIMPAEVMLMVVATIMGKRQLDNTFFVAF